MFFYKKAFYIISIASIALNFLLLTVVVSGKNNDLMINQPQSPPTEDALSDESESFSVSAQNSDSSSDFPSVQNNYDKNIYLAEIAQYSDIVIPYSADKDSSYLEETLFIGDSNTAGLASFGYMPLQNVLGKKSMGIQGVISNSFVWFKGYSQPVNIVKAVKLLKPRRIVVNFGTNNTIGTTPTEFKSMYKKALYAISQAYPHCDIIVAAVLPVGYYRENYNIKQQTIDSFNIVLAQLCSENGYYFLDYSEAFKNSETGYMQKSCVADDGVHLNDKGYRLLLEYINDHQLHTTDRRPDTKNIPVRTAAPQSSAELPQAVTAEADNIPETESDSQFVADNIDNTENCADNNSIKSSDSIISHYSDNTDEENSNTENFEIISDSSSDLGNINSDKTIYDPFL